MMCGAASFSPRSRSLWLTLSAPAREDSGKGGYSWGGDRPEVTPSPSPSLAPPPPPAKGAPALPSPARPPPSARLPGAGRQGVNAGPLLPPELSAVLEPQPCAVPHAPPAACEPPGAARLPEGGCAPPPPAPPPLPARVSMRRGLGARTRGFSRAGTGTRRRRRRRPRWWRGRPGSGPGPGPGPRWRWLCLQSGVAPAGAPYPSRPLRSPPAGRRWGPGGAASGTFTGNGAPLRAFRAPRPVHFPLRSLPSLGLNPPRPSLSSSAPASLPPPSFLCLRCGSRASSALHQDFLPTPQLKDPTTARLCNPLLPFLAPLTPLL